MIFLLFTSLIFRKSMKYNSLIWASVTFVLRYRFEEGEVARFLELHRHVSWVSIFYRYYNRYSMLLFYIIYNWPLQPFSQDYSLASHATHAVWVNFIRVWLDLQINFDSDGEIFEKLFHGRFILLSELLPQICLQEIAKEIFFFIFHFDTNSGFTSNKHTLPNRLNSIRQNFKFCLVYWIFTFKLLNLPPCQKLI